MTDPDAPRRLRLVRHADAAELLERAGDWLTRREAEHNLVLGVLGTLVEDPAYVADPPYLVSVERASDRATVAVAIRTPPWRLVLSEVDDLSALDLLAADIIDVMPDLPGLVGPSDQVDRLAERVAAGLGLGVQRSMRERAFRLSSVRAPRAVSG